MLYQPYFSDENELTHHGVLGMKWGVRRNQKTLNRLSKTTEKLSTKKTIAKTSANEWDEIAKYQKEKGRAKSANRSKAAAVKDRYDANKIDEKLQRSKKLEKVAKNLSDAKKLTTKNLIKEIDKITGTEISTGKQFVRDLFYSKKQQLIIKESDYINKNKGW